MVHTNQIIDLHSHFLPGIDDGAQSVYESVKMLTDSRKQGVAACVATPHCILHRAGDLDKFLSRRNEAYDKVRQAALASGNDVPDMFLGGEVYLDNNILKNFDGIERLCFSGTNYILVELPRQRLDRRITEWIFGLTVKGLNPILAHVERAEPEEIEKIGIWDLDIVFQVNAESFMSFFSRRRLKKIFAKGKKYVVSSDMHDTVRRQQCMADARKISQSKFPEITDKIFYSNGADILRLR